MQKEGEVIHIVADRLEDLTPLLHRVGAMDFPHRYAPADGGKGVASRPAQGEGAGRDQGEVEGFPLNASPRERGEGDQAKPGGGVAAGFGGSSARRKKPAPYPSTTLRVVPLPMLATGRIRSELLLALVEALVMLDPGHPEARHSGAVDRALPGGELLEAERVALRRPRRR